ncbi:MAG: hypothetical protein ACI4C5_06335 [Lachnospiraceae bacterium]
MLAAVKGYYDGTQIVVDENDKKTLNIGDEVIITILDRLNTTGQEKRADKRRRIVDLEKYVVSSGRSTDEIDNYIRELRNDDRI